MCVLMTLKRIIVDVVTRLLCFLIHCQEAQGQRGMDSGVSKSQGHSTSGQK